MEDDTGKESKSYIMKDLEWCVKEPDLTLQTNVSNQAGE